MTCIRQRRLPSFVTSRLAAPQATWLHALLLNPRLLSRPAGEPVVLTYEESCRLHCRYPCRNGYRYDQQSKRARAMQRVATLLLAARSERPLQWIEVGAGDGNVAKALCERGHQCMVLDVKDWRDAEVRQFQIPFRAIGDDGRYDCDDSSADVVYSFNTFEHIADPAQALREMVRVVRPGGIIYASFGPLFNSAFGLHAYRTVYHPYPQFLIGDDTLRRYAELNGIWDLGECRDQFQYVNRWSVKQFRELFTSAEGTAVESMHVDYDLSHLGLVYRHLPCFSGRGLTVDELTAEHFTVCLSKLGE